jgi:hypothetical protein
MKHAGRSTLTRIEPLLEALRMRSALQEKRPGVFYLKSKAFLHFHDDPSGVFADVKLDATFERMRVTSESEQSDLLERIDDRLSTIETRTSDKRRGAERGGKQRRGRASSKRA